MNHDHHAGAKPLGSSALFSLNIRPSYTRIDASAIVACLMRPMRALLILFGLSALTSCKSEPSHEAHSGPVESGTVQERVGGSRDGHLADPYHASLSPKPADGQRLRSHFAERLVFGRHARCKEETPGNRP